MDKNDILDYVTETPGNTNRAVLGSMLDSIGGSDRNEGILVTFTLIINEEAQSLEDAYIITTDKTFQEILEAKKSGKIVDAIINQTAPDTEEQYIMGLELLGLSNYGVSFGCVQPQINNNDYEITGLNGYTIEMDPNNNINLTQGNYNFPDYDQSEFFIVTFTNNNESITCDKTRSEILTTGKPIYAKLVDGDDITEPLLYRRWRVGRDEEILFYYLKTNLDGNLESDGATQLILNIIKIKYDDSITTFYKYISFDSE